MSLSGGGIGSTLTGGIQDIAAFVPLLGTTMLDPCELGAYTRISLRCISTHVDLWKSQGSQRWIQEVACLLRIQRY